MRYKVVGVNEEDDYNGMDYEPMESKSSQKKEKTKVMIRLESSKDKWSTMSIPQAEIPGAEVGDLIEVTFGRKNQGQA